MKYQTQYWQCICAVIFCGLLSVHEGQTLATAADQVVDLSKENAMLLVNGGFEETDKKSANPIGWKSASLSPKHKASWVEDVKHSGEHAVMIKVDKDAQPQWSQWNQSEIPVKSGKKFQLTAFVKAQEVNGIVGFYVHVLDEKNRLVLNHVQILRNSEFDWKQFKYEFKVPDMGVKMSIGTVLKGTGTAWYDDFELVEVSP